MDTLLARIMQSVIVPQEYMQNLEEDNYLSNGRHLKNGMVVLIAEGNMRRDIDLGTASSFMLGEVLKKNRWCTISEVSFTQLFVSFVGTYDDGLKIKWDGYSQNHPWLIKKDSVAKEIKNTAKRARVTEVMKRAMLEQDTATYLERPDMVKETLRASVERIMGIFGEDM